MKKPAIYGIVGACAFSGASGWTYYKLYTQDGKFNTSSSFDIVNNYSLGLHLLLLV